MRAEPKQRRSHRREVRVTAALRQRRSRAASLRGQCVADFVERALEGAAQRAIAGADATWLSREDFDALRRALDADAEPNAALREAADQYRELVSDAA